MTILSHKQGDTSSPLRWQLLADNEPMDIADETTTVKVRIKNRYTGIVLVDSETMTKGTDSYVEYLLSENEVANTGVYDIETVIEYAGGIQRRIPTVGFDRLYLFPNLGNPIPDPPP
jgi:hypothetical protein